MPLGSHGGGTRSYRQRYPDRQGPDVVEGGGGGGGTAPATPSDVTTPTVGYNLFSWGNIIHRVVSTGTYAEHTTWGFNGARCNITFLHGYGTNNQFKGSTAAADSPGPDAAYTLQRSLEGLPSTGTNWGNSSRSGLGFMKAKQNGAIDKSYIGIYVYAKSGNLPVSTGLYGDMTNTTLRADVATKMGLLAAFTEFMDGSGIVFDTEVGQWTPPAGSGLTAAQYNVILEQFGYECGVQIFTAFPACEIIEYSVQFNNSWHEILTSGFTNGGRANSVLPRVQFMFGIMRAHTAMNATVGAIRWVDHQWYRASPGLGCSTPTALKWNTQGTLASLSRDLPAATWNHIAPLFHISPFSWAGTDNTAFFTNTQEGQPTWTNNQETYRQWTMGGWRCEYTVGSDQGFPGGNAGQGLYVGQNNYSYPTGRLAAFTTITHNTSGSYSTTAPTLSASKSGSGGTRTLSGTASHAFGIRCIKAYIYPSGTPVMAQMTFQPGTTTPPTAGLANAYMDWTLTLTGVGSNQHAIVTAYSTLDQQKSVVLTL